MTNIEAALVDPSRLGTVEDVNGSSVSVKLSDGTPSGLVFVRGEAYRVGQVGGFVRIPSGYVNLYGVISQVGAGAAPVVNDSSSQQGSRWLRVELVGQGGRDAKFERGIAQYPSIGDAVHIVTESDLKSVYAPGDEDGYVAVGRVASAESISAYLDLNRLINRHSAIVGSTGSGKSNAVANFLAKLSSEKSFKSSRIVLFDLHGEYVKTFGDRARVFRVGANAADGERELHVPYWALTCEEFISISLGSISGIPLALMQEMILAAKRSSTPGGAAHSIPAQAVTLDTPLPFSVHKLWHDLFSLQCATHRVSRNQNQSAATRTYLQGGVPVADLVGDANTIVRPQFRPLKDVKDDADKVFAGAHSDLPRTHLEYLEGKLRDPRMQFLYRPGNWSVNTSEGTVSDLDDLLSEWIGADHPISVIDLSGIPTAIIDDLVGAVLRILYDSIFWGRLKSEGGRSRPLLVVLEEAHSYLSSESKGRASVAARRIAKEGRKYGVGLMLVSQRPSEIDSTILSQCGTLVALRLTNDQDRAQVAACASDNLKGLFSMLPILRTGEALIVGEAVNMPIRARIDRPSPELRPNSEDPMVVVPKDKDGNRVRPGGWTEPAIRDDYGPLVEAWRLLNPLAGQ